MFRKLLQAELRLIIHKPVLLSAILIPFLLVLILKFIFPFISNLIDSGSRLQPENYFTIVSLILIFSIPMIVGIMIASGYANRNLLSGPAHINQKEVNVIFLIRIAETMLLSFFLVLLSIVVTNPVKSEGWLRSIYISSLLSLQSVNILFLVTNRIFHKAGSGIIYFICALLLIAVPVGLLLKSPMNCLAFFSPLYWISWAWITMVKIESIICGVISVTIITGPVILIYRILFKSKSV